MIRIECVDNLMTVHRFRYIVARIRRMAYNITYSHTGQFHIDLITIVKQMYVISNESIYL